MKRHGPRDVAAVTPMDLLLAFLHLAAFVGLGFGLAMPRARRLAMGLLGLAAATGFGMAVTGPERRTLTTVHTYAGFEGDAQEVSMVSFPTGTVEASGTAWALVFGAFAAIWILVLWSLKDRPLRNALVLPLLFAWSATATWLGMQMVAAPAEVVQPLGLDRFLYPAGLAVALVAARNCKRFVTLLLVIGGSALAARLPAAIFSKIASDRTLGTSLDIGTVRDIVNPMTQMQFDPRLEPGSGAQQFWLIWLEHVIMFPAIYLLSLVGIAFGVFMFHHHGADSHGADSQGADRQRALEV